MASMVAMALITFAGILVFVLSTPGKMTLRLEGTGYKDTNEEIFQDFEAEEGMTFSVSFIHSVNKSEVKETYEIRSGEIFLISCLYSSFGAGVATEIEEGQSLSYTENGEMLISDIDVKMNNLSYIVGTVSDHILEINEEEISLSQLCGKNSTVRFGIIK